MLHELTHCLLFQRTGTRDTWKDRAESPCGSAKAWPSPPPTRHTCTPAWKTARSGCSGSPPSIRFADGEALSANKSSEVYGVALHAFSFLQSRYGAARLEQLMEAMRQGDDFEGAFEQEARDQVKVFQRDFENYLKLRAFRGSRRSVPLLRPELRQPPH